MGWTVLYIAFGIVALWLLGEVLLQYKARLRWRLLAFAGFLAVVGGVLLSSRAVIAVGGVAFAVGQTYVTLSFRRGFSTGWALGGKPGASRRRRSAGGARKDPTLEVSELSDDSHGATDEAHGAEAPFGGEADGYGAYGGYDPAGSGADGDAGTYGQQPEDTDRYGARGSGAWGEDRAGDADSDGAGRVYGAYDAYAEPGTGHEDGAAGHESTGYGASEYGSSEYGSSDYGYGDRQHQYAAYADAYDTAQYAGYTPADGHAPAAEGYGAQDYGTQGYADPYAPEEYQPYPQPYTDTPPGGVWVPQQRETGREAASQDGQPDPYGYDPAHDEQRYRY
ncbi:hypothetical protein NPS70_27460 [Streptomyces sp. C10-9-1]|uniref:hypothetical protein n=1 Tax=Streptomyces sp. C10-9-1 TaxID=1859285 RepID=UPI002112BE70|nr:hypothetical protein [Streptomyces sp. C10-9-1]MCQ6556894.1 hypothetical protein [Streptomyces sp. C10-9-1]